MHIDRRSLSLLALVAFFATLAFAQKTAVAPGTLETNLRKHVAYLASDKLEGRRTGEKGATAAAEYVAKSFANARLTPGFKNTKGKGNFLQPFPYVAGVKPGENNLLRIIPSDPTHENKMEAGVNFQPFGNSINGDVASAPLVFAGYGITTADKKYDDYSGLDVNGKIVLVFDGTPDGPREQFGSFNIHAKANLAKERGAKAVIVIARSDDFKADPLSRLTYEPTIGDTAIPVLAIMREHGAELLSAGVADSKDLFAVEKQVAAKTAAMPVITATAKLKVDLVKKTTEAYNVIGLLEGTDPVLKNEAIVIGAHYDHLGRGGSGSLAANSIEIHHGADDNASGTAAVIELARHFAKEKKNKRTLIFMAFGGEEEGLLGSKYYVNNPVWPLEKTVAMINLDMVGRLNQDKLNIGGIGTATEWKDWANKVNKNVSYEGSRGNTMDLGPAKLVEFILQLNEDGFGPSDHSSFYGKQIPVLFFFTGTHIDYHKPSDTFEKINYSGLSRITNYVAAIAKSVDENPARPTYKVAQSVGMGGRMTFNVSLGTIPSYAEGNNGLAIDGVRDGSPAAKAGLKGGDTIIKLAGKDVRNISDYMFALGSMKAGEEYEVVIKRGSETITLKIIPAPAARR
jgi:aminopeptidase YwaD